MTKAILLVTLLLASAGAALSQDKTNKTEPESVAVEPAPKDALAGHVYEACKRYFSGSFRTRESVSRKATCNGYFFAVGGILLELQTENVDTKTCIPRGSSTHDIIKAFIEWGSKEESDLNISSPEATLMALRDKYPCS